MFKKKTFSFLVSHLLFLFFIIFLSLISLIHYLFNAFFFSFPTATPLSKVCVLGLNETFEWKVELLLLLLLLQLFVVAAASSWWYWWWECCLYCWCHWDSDGDDHIFRGDGRTAAAIARPLLRCRWPPVVVVRQGNSI